jgi:hypothetical protein
MGVLSDSEAAELEAARAMSLGAKSPGLGLPVDFQGNYELYAILTHKGRSADSGHYMAWVRQEGGESRSDRSWQMPLGCRTDGHDRCDDRRLVLLR